MTRWEVWRAGDSVWLERAAGRQELSVLQRRVASFAATAEQAASHLRFMTKEPT